MPVVTINDIQMYYEEYGQGTPLVLLHHFSGSSRVWQNFVEPLSVKYRLIIPDLRAHGRSTGSLETIHHNRFAADTIGLLDLLEVERTHFVGHSSGGMCLPFIGLHHPERVHTLSLVCATYTFDERAREHMQEVAKMEATPEEIQESRLFHSPVHDDDYWKVLRQAFYQFTLDPQELPFTPADLHAIGSPVLVMHGDRDEFFPVDIPVTMYQSMPKAELCILPATGHGLPYERPALFLEILQDFLSRNAER